MKTVEEILLDLVAIPSVSSVSNDRVIEYALAFLDPAAWTISLHQYRDGSGTEKTNLVAQTGKSNGGPAELAFVCHTDTVPYEAGWEEAVRPAIRDGKLYGRGSCDVKGFLACVLTALSHTKLEALSRPLAVVLTADEEVGCIGAKHLVGKQALHARYGVIGEPTCLQPIKAGKGYGLAEIVVRGKEGHSAFPARGRSAIVDAAHIVCNVERLAQQISTAQQTGFDPPYTTLNIGLIQGGTAKNIVPGECRITVEWRPVPGQDPGWVANLLKEEIASAAAERPGLDAELRVLRTDPPFEPSTSSKLCEIAESLSSRNATTVAFGTEAAHLRPLIDEVIVFGPGDMGTAHKSGEHVSLDELNRCVDILSALIGRICG